jgi:hypothetical protein
MEPIAITQMAFARYFTWNEEKQSNETVEVGGIVKLEINCFAKVLAIPALQYPLAFRCVGFRSHVQFKGGSVPQHDFSSPFVLHHAQAVTPPKKVMALAADHLALRLPGLRLKPGPLPLNPRKLAHHRQTHGVVGHGQRSGHSHATRRRINPEVQVLNGLANDVNIYAAHGDHLWLSIHSGS